MGKRNVNTALLILCSVKKKLVTVWKDRRGKEIHELSVVSLPWLSMRVSGQITIRWYIVTRPKVNFLVMMSRLRTAAHLGPADSRLLSRKNTSIIRKYSMLFTVLIPTRFSSSAYRHVR
jgi:hypothetical protein